MGYRDYAGEGEASGTCEHTTEPGECDVVCGDDNCVHGCPLHANGDERPCTVEGCECPGWIEPIDIG